MLSSQEHVFASGRKRTTMHRFFTPWSSQSQANEFPKSCW